MVIEVVPSDFFPWSGDHPEDALDEVTTRNGYYDKLPTNHNELGTAKPSLWKSVKHKAGARILSSLLASTLRQRQLCGRVLGDSTFKLPPRVTLTDTKREAWLNDLSNPSISLRRLSRTIPHGIRGKMLLDHCLAKYVPVPRAVWLVKCVGANEIRAFKRKGAGVVFTVGGEVKWIKEWTTAIEQFVISVFTSAANDGNKQQAQTDYVLEVTQQLYSEQLMDRGQYLDFLVQKTGESDLDRLLLWLVIIGAHRHDLVFQSWRGKRLVEFLLSHLDNVNSLGAQYTSFRANTRDLQISRAVIYDGLHTITNAVTQILEFVMFFSTERFLIPERWVTFETLIRTGLINNRPTLQPTYASLHQQNTMLQHHLCQPSFQERLELRRQMLTILDVLFSNPAYALVADRCLQLTTDRESIIRCCLHWCSDQDSHERYRVYAAARLIAELSKDGANIQTHILDCIGYDISFHDCSETIVYRVILELILLGIFSIGKYLQWLMAKGLLHRQSTRTSHRNVSLLLELPPSLFPAHSLDLRGYLISRAGLNHRNDATDLEAAKSFISNSLPGLLGYGQGEIRTSDGLDFSTLSLPIKYESARWLCSCLIRNESHGEAEATLQRAPSPPLNRMTLSEFATISTIMLALDEFPIFAKVMGRLLECATYDTLLAIVDTVNCYVEVFLAIDAARHLFELAYRRVLGTKDSELDQHLLESSIDLAARVSNTDEEIKVLRKQLLKLSAGSAVSFAYSPISDTTVEPSYAGENSFLDELDQMLATGGTSMDGQTLTRIFGMLTTRQELKRSDSKGFLRVAHLLSRLQKFDDAVFGKLISRWLDTLLVTEGRPSLFTILSPFICLRMVSMDAVISSGLATLQRTESSTRQFMIAIDLLDLVSKDDKCPSLGPEFRSYRMRQQQMSIRSLSSQSILRILKFLAKSYEPVAGSNSVLKHFSLDKERLRVFIGSILHTTANEHPASLPTDADVQNQIGNLLLQLDNTDEDRNRDASELRHVLDGFDPPTRQFELIAPLNSRAEDTAELVYNFAKTVIRLPDDTPLDHFNSWALLVSRFSVENAKLVREDIESALINHIYGSPLTFSRATGNITYGLLVILDASAFSVSASDHLAMGQRILVSLELVQKKIDAQKDCQLPEPILYQIDSLLALILLYWPFLQDLPTAQENLCKIIASLGLVAQRLDSCNLLRMSGKLRSVLCKVLDSLPDITRVRVIGTNQTRHAFSDVFIQSLEIDSRKRFHNIHIAISVEHGDNKGLPATRQSVKKPFTFRRWELMSEATPAIAENDSSLSLILFGTKRSVL